MKRLITIVVTAAILGTTAAQADTFEVADSERTVRLVGAVHGGTISLAQQIQKLALESDDPIDMLINSPGGSVYAGMAVVDAIKFAQQRGVKVRCVSGVMAASMGFIILAECSERYALPNARLLFHPISISVQGARINEIVPDLVETLREEDEIKTRLCRQLNFDREFFEQHYYAETFWQAYNLHKRSPKFVEIVDDVVGFGEDLFRYRNAMPIFFGGAAADVIERYETGGAFSGTQR